MDEPALREGLPLKQDRWGSYLEWAVDSFRLSTAVAAPHTQIVTHLCYSDFQDILKVVSACYSLPICTLSQGKRVVWLAHDMCSGIIGMFAEPFCTYTYISNVEWIIFSVYVKQLSVNAFAGH